MGGLGVGLGAFGAHALKSRLEDAGMTQTWDTAVKYHLIHAVALLALAAWRNSLSGQASVAWAQLAWVARCWVGGIVLFSGSLYALALGAPHWVGAITPLGGLAFIAGWVLVAVVGWKK